LLPIALPVEPPGPELIEIPRAPDGADLAEVRNRPRRSLGPARPTHCPLMDWVFAV